jgi:hypothetical protein
MMMKDDDDEKRKRKLKIEKDESHFFEQYQFWCLESTCVCYQVKKKDGDGKKT